MDHGTHTAPTGSAGLDVAALLVRLVLLLVTAAVAGSGLFGGKPRWPAAALSAVLAVVSAVAFGVQAVGAAVHAVLVLAVSALLSRKLVPAARWTAVALLVLVVLESATGHTGAEFAAGTVYVGSATVWFGLVSAPRRPERFSQLTLALALLLVVSGAVQVLLSGVAFDRRLHTTLFGLALVAAVVLPLAALAVRGARGATVLVAAGLLAWSTVAVLPRPADLPVPGVPLLTEAAGVPVLVSPQRPGRNLVHLPESAGGAVTVAGVAATHRAGAEGYWAEVDLPAGRSDVMVNRGGDTSTIEVDTGSAPGPVVDAECASAALGGLVAGRKDVLVSCPSSELSEQDGDALRKLTGFLAARHTPVITLASDASPRGTAAAAVVREAAAAQGIPVTDGTTADSALVVVSGWSEAATTLTQAAHAQRETPAYTYGLFLAPWLMTGPVVNTVSASTAPLRFDPREQSAVGFTVALGNAFGGESPSVGGFREWLGTDAPQAPVQLFATAQVNAMPMNPGEPMAPGMATVGDGPGHWVPDGTVVPVSFPLG